MMKRYIEPKVLAWLLSGPRTSNQIAALVGITNNHASVTLRRMQHKGIIRALLPLEPPVNRQPRQTERRQYLRYYPNGR